MSLDLFDVLDVDYRYEASWDLAFQPALTGTRPITFSILASDDYYDRNELRFLVKVRLTDPAAGYQGLKAKFGRLRCQQYHEHLLRQQFWPHHLSRY